MFYKELEKSKRVLNLQLFAEGDGDGAFEGGAGNPDGDASPKVPTFETYADFQSYIDSEKDKHSNKAIQTAKQKWEADKQQAIEDAKSEAEKYGQMTAEQKAQAEQEKRMEELEKRERELNRRELKATAIDTLSEKGLPASLANIMQFTDAEACAEHIDTIEKTWRKELELAVDKKLAGSVDIPGSKGNTVKKGEAKGEIGERIAGRTQAKPVENPYFKHN